MDVALLVVTLVIGIILPACAIYFVVYFQHVDDKLSAWAPKILAVLGLTLAGYNLFLLPLDIANGHHGRLPVKAISLTLLTLSACFCTLIIPFMMFYYEGIPLEKTKGQVAQQIVHASKWTAPFVAVLVVAAIPLYIFFGYANVNQTVLSSKFVQGNASLFSNFCDATSLTSLHCFRSMSTVKLRVNPLVFAIAVVDLLGWAVLSVLASIGAVAAVWDSLREFRLRNSLLTKREFESEKLRICRHAERLLSEHATIQQLLEGTSKEQKQARSREKCFIKQVHQLEGEYNILLDRNCERKKYRFASLNKYALFMSAMTCLIVYLLWTIQIIIYALPRSFARQPPISFLNAVLVTLARIPLVSTLIYLIFASFLILFLMKGLMKLGSSCGWISIYPMKMGETTMNSLLFNVEIILFSSIAVLHLSILSLYEYAPRSYIAYVFVKQIQSLTLFKYVYPSFLFVFLAFAPITIVAYVISSCIRSRRRRRKRNVPTKTQVPAGKNMPEELNPKDVARFNNLGYDPLQEMSTQNQLNVQNNSLANQQRTPFYFK